MLPGAWRPFWPPRHTPRISWRIKVTPMCSRGRCCAMNETAATKCRVFAFSKRTCAAKTVSMSLYCLKYGAWIQVCTGHGRSLLSSEQQFSKRVIIKAELRPKAGSSIFLSITVTSVYFDNKVFDRNRRNDFYFYRVAGKRSPQDPPTVRSV